MMKTFSPNKTIFQCIKFHKFLVYPGTRKQEAGRREGHETLGSVLPCAHARVSAQSPDAFPHQALPASSF